MKTDCDVVIIGAGPAGALTALLLARAGRSVKLIDKGSFPRPKVCGDCFNPRIGALLARHGLSLRFTALPHGMIRTVELQSDGTPFHQQNLDESQSGFRAIDRGLFDQWLAEEARQAGAEFLEKTRIFAVRPDGSVETDHGSYRGKHLIGADGRNSLVAQQMGLIRRPSCGRMGWQAALSGIAPRETVSLNIFKEGYYGLVHLGADRANLALVADLQAKIKPDEIIRRYLPGVGIESLRGIAPISRSAMSPAAGRIWLVGDAARVVEPFTGEGIYFALASAEQAALLLLESPRRSISELAALYKRRHQALYRGELGVNRLTEWLLGQGPKVRGMIPRLRYWPGLLPFMTRRVLRA